MEHKYHEILEQRMCKELDELEEKYRSEKELTEIDLKRMDMIYHALKNKEKVEGGYGMPNMSYDMYGGNNGGYSGRRSMTGGYGYSGHYPYGPAPYYDNTRQW